MGLLHIEEDELKRIIREEALKVVMDVLKCTYVKTGLDVSIREYQGSGWKFVNDVRLQTPSLEIHFDALYRKFPHK